MYIRAKKEREGIGSIAPDVFAGAVEQG
jgi:hypothetical protein